jgi:hypothetical protein
MHGDRIFPAPRPTRPTGGSGLIYVRAPDSPAEAQLQCFGADRVSKTLSFSEGPGVECEVVERSSSGGAVERSERLRFDATAQKELVLRGATVWGSFSNEPLEGGFFAITAGWGSNGQDHGVRHLVQFGSSGKPSPVPNRLLETMTGTVSVLTPLGTEVSYGCVAK